MHIQRSNIMTLLLGAMMWDSAMNGIALYMLQGNIYIEINRKTNFEGHNNIAFQNYYNGFIVL